MQKKYKIDTEASKRTFGFREAIDSLTPSEGSNTHTQTPSKMIDSFKGTFNRFHW